MKYRCPMALSVKLLLVGLVVAIGVWGVAAGPALAQFCNNQVVTSNCIRFTQSTTTLDSPSLCLGSGGRNVIIAGDDGSVISGRGGADMLIGSVGPDHICGNSGDDVIVGLGGEDVLSGDAGADVLIDNGGFDIYNGGPGKDTCIGTDLDDVQISC